MDKLIRIFAQPIGFAGTAFGIAGLIYLGISFFSEVSFLMKPHERIAARQ